MNNKSTNHIQKNIETTRKDQIRPSLTIDTNFERNRKKAWHRLFQGKDIIESEITSPELLTPPYTASPDSPVPSQNTHIRTQPSEEPGGVQSVFRKFHARSLSKIRPSTDIPTSFDVVPDAPEPIIPTAFNWSPKDSFTSPPLELDENPILNSSVQKLSNKEKRMARLYTDVDITKLNRKATVRSVDRPFVPSKYTSDSMPDISSRRRSCPGDYDNISHLTTCIDNRVSSDVFSERDIIVITEEHTRNMTALKKYTPTSNKNIVLRGCQKAKAQAVEIAAKGNPVNLSHSNGIYSTIGKDNFKHPFIPTVFDPDTHKPILDFATIEPRKFQLQRKSSWKREAKALDIWQQSLKNALDKPMTVDLIMPEKREKYALTRLFILKEFFTTEVTFWNQLYYAKIMFYDPLASAIESDNPFVKEGDMDPFANLFELMQFSAKLINRLLYFQPEQHTYDFVGTNLLDMSKDLVVFLRCAIDYKGNRKTISRSSKVLDLYKQKLYSRKETSQFTMEDYLIIPIQRVARYGLLIADLIKHTEKSHPDYESLVKTYKVVTSLATAMDSIQQKQK